MKKIVSILACVCFMVCFTTVSFAATDIKTHAPKWIVAENPNTLIGILDYAGMTPEAKQLYMEFMHVLTGASYDTNYQYYITLSNRILSFYRIPSSVTVSCVKTTTGKDILSVRQSCVFSLLQFYNNQSVNSDGTFPPYNSIINSSYSFAGSGLMLGDGQGVNLLVAASPNAKIDSSVTSSILENMKPSHSGGLGIKDNNPDSEIPDPPLPPVNPPKPPEIPEGDPTYVPYDTSIWNKFLTYVQGNMGSAVNIGLIIFAAIFGIWLVVKVVKYFTKG